MTKRIKMARFLIIILILVTQISFLIYPCLGYCQEPVHLGEIKLKSSNSNVLNKLEQEAEELNKKKQGLKQEENLYLERQGTWLKDLERAQKEEIILPEPKIPLKAEVIPQKEIELPEGPLDLLTAVEIAISNDLPVRIGLEEIDLARLKRQEAKRAVFPSASIKATTTDGEALGTEFEERSYGVGFEQPVYYGGRLRNAIRQSELGISLAEKKYNKIIADLFFEVSQAYFGLITAKMNLRLQEDLLKGAKNDLEIAKKRFERGLSTKSELLNVESQMIQIEYQVSSAQKDIELAKLELSHKLSLENDKEIAMPDEILFTENLNIEKDKSLALAIANRPEVHINQLQVEFNRYEAEIAKGKDKLKVDFSGFLGESAGAYKTEKLNYESDWFVGLKASLPFGKNTSGYSFQTNKTSRKLGQTDRTRTSSHSLEVGIFDDLANKSEIKSAKISYDKAIADLEQIRKDVGEEVNDAFFEYEKARLQIESATKKAGFRKEQLKIIEAQAKLNEALTSDVLEARIKLADEETLRMEAISSLNIAIAKLNKAIGVPNYYK